MKKNDDPRTLQVIDPMLVDSIRQSVERGPGDYLIVISVDEKGTPTFTAAKLGAPFQIDRT